jgi:hypothetical protein
MTMSPRSPSNRSHITGAVSDGGFSIDDECGIARTVAAEQSDLDKSGDNMPVVDSELGHGHGMKTESKYGAGWGNTDHCGYITDNSVLLLCYSLFIGCCHCAALNTIILRSVLIKRSSSPMMKYFGCSIHCPL